MEDSMALQHGATGINIKGDVGFSKWSNLSPGTKKATASERIGLGH